MYIGTKLLFKGFYTAIKIMGFQTMFVINTSDMAWQYALLVEQVMYDLSFTVGFSQIVKL